MISGHGPENNFGEKLMDIYLILDRWVHVMAGITWIGLLYYFNFVQVPGLGKAKADGTAAGRRGVGLRDRISRQR